MTTDQTFARYGTHHPEPESRTLSAGPLFLILQDGNLRSIRFMGYEVLRAVSFLVRDKDWGTCAAEITGLTVDERADAFSVRYHSRYLAPSGAHLDGDISISGARGGLTFEADYVADADFETARAGFTVLHPLAGVSGQPVTVQHGDGSVEHGRWPDVIDPWQPFKDIAAIIHRVAEGIEAETRFSGDVFEMEDQRNWTDGSYKTYVRPLALPWPYLVPKGEKKRQSVTVSIRSTDAARPAPSASGPIAIQLAPTDIRLPEIGIGLRPDCAAAEAAATDVLEASGARHLVAHFDPLAGHGPDVLKTYAEIARTAGLGITLELAVPCIRPLSEELAEVAGQVQAAALPLDSLFVSPSVDRQSTPPGSKWPECPPLEDVYAAARAAFPGIRLGGGMMSYFTELNRKRVPGDRVDYVSHCTNPIVHAADDLSVMQSFEALAYVVKSVRAIYGDKPYRIGPSTIAMRQNPYGSATKDNPHRARIPMANVDPRHNAKFGAAWTLAYAATVAPAGLEVLTLSTLAGPFGLVAGPAEPAGQGGLRPLAHVVSALAALSGRQFVMLTTSRPSAVLGLAAATDQGETTLLLANISIERQFVELGGVPKSCELLDIVDATAAGFTPVPASALLEFGPYACARVVV